MLARSEPSTFKTSALDRSAALAFQQTMWLNLRGAFRLYKVTYIISDSNSWEQKWDHVEPVNELGSESRPDSSIVVIAQLQQNNI